MSEHKVIECLHFDQWVSTNFSSVSISTNEWAHSYKVSPFQPVSEHKVIKCIHVDKRRTPRLDGGRWTGGDGADQQLQKSFKNIITSRL